MTFCCHSSSCRNLGHIWTPGVHGDLRKEPRRMEDLDLLICSEIIEFEESFLTENLMFETLKLFFSRDIRSYMLHINASHYQVPSGSCSSCETACLSESRPTHCRVTACFWSFCRNAFIWWPLFGATENTGLPPQLELRKRPRNPLKLSHEGHH